MDVVVGMSWQNSCNCIAVVLSKCILESSTQPPGMFGKVRKKGIVGVRANKNIVLGFCLTRSVDA